MTDEDGTAGGVEHDELVVGAAALVENDAAAPGCSDPHRGVDGRGRVQAQGRRGDDAVGRSGPGRRRQSAAGHLRQTGRGDPGGRGEVIGLLEAGRGRRGRDSDVVEGTARVVGADTEEARVESIGSAVDPARVVLVGEFGRPVEEHGDDEAVHRHHDGGEGPGLDRAGRALRIDEPPGAGAAADDDLVGRLVDAGELEVGGRLVVEDQVGVGTPSAGRLDDTHLG